MADHEHASCEHEDLGYCRQHDVAWCKACSREWGVQSTWYPYPYWTYTSTSPTDASKYVTTTTNHTEHAGAPA